MKVESIDDAKVFFKKKVDEQIVGLGVTAFNRVGPEDFSKDYQIFSFKKTGDDEAIKKRIKLQVLEELANHDLKGKKRNSTTIISSDFFRDYVKKTKGKVAVLLYRSSEKIEKISADLGIKVIANKTRYGKTWLENKIVFRKILKECQIRPIPGFLEKLGEIEYEKTKKIFDPFVIQLPDFTGGGKGTFFIFGPEDLKKIKSSRFFSPYLKKQVLVSKFIKGPSPSITGCVLRQAILHAGLQYQILGVKGLVNPSLGRGAFCGHEWTNLDFKENIKKQTEEIVKKLGNYLKKIGYQGIFGIDFLLDQESQIIYPIEVNPRLLGSFPIMNMIQTQKQQVPLLAYHILEFLGKDFLVSEKKYNQQSWEKTRGAQLLFHNPYFEAVKVKKIIKSGVYTTGGQYQKPEYRLSGVLNSELALVDNVTVSEEPFNPKQRFFRLILKKGVLTNDFMGINEQTKNLINVFLRLLII